VHVLIYTDGGARGNPGPAAAGVCILDADADRCLHEGGYYLGETTNNVAEYTGLLRALEKALELGATRVSVRSDSELMVRQINGQYKVKAQNLKPLFQDAVALLSRFERWAVEHVRREGNKRADQLANAAMDARMDVDYSG